VTCKVIGRAHYSGRRNAVLVDLIDHGTAQATVSAVEHSILAGGDSALRLIETNQQGIVRTNLDDAGLIRLSITNFAHAMQSGSKLLRRIVYPAGIGRHQAVAQQ
jgi:hypothetical protein